MGSLTKFVTFYSYKGGVGRTSALVNTAAIQAMKGNKVVILDFDLEAPGISHYLSKLLPKYDHFQNGILEYLCKAIDGKSIPNLFPTAFDLTSSLKNKNGGKLWAISAGNTRDKNYTSRLEQLVWSELFQEKNGELLLKNLKNQITDEFGNPDYVFVDSRTGITETAGVCTRYLADMLVILTSLNKQNVAGTAMIYKDLIEEKKEIILVASNVPAGMPLEKGQLFHSRVKDFTETFNQPPDIFIHYYPTLSLEENLPGLKLPSTDEDLEASYYQTDSLFQAYRQLARVIEKKNKDSYLKKLDDAAWEVKSIYYGLILPGEHRVIASLKEEYGSRPLTEIISDLSSVAEACAKNPQDPTKWKRHLLKKCLKRVNKVTNKAVKSGCDGLLNFLTSSVIKLISSEGKAMETSLEIFCDPNRFESIVLKEIARNHYDWPIKYFSRRLAEEDVNGTRDDPFLLYNLSHCLIQTSQRRRSKVHLKRFLEIFGNLMEKKLRPSATANFYFCAAIAFREIGKIASSIKMVKNSEEAIVNIKPESTVFSPLEYREIPVSEFSKQIKKFKSELKLETKS